MEKIVRKSNKGRHVGKESLKPTFLTDFQLLDKGIHAVESKDYDKQDLTNFINYSSKYVDDAIGEICSASIYHLFARICDTFPTGYTYKVSNVTKLSIATKGPLNNILNIFKADYSNSRVNIIHLNSMAYKAIDEFVETWKTWKHQDSVVVLSTSVLDTYNPIVRVAGFPFSIRKNDNGSYRLVY